jgi:hypothetical protein
VSRQVNTRIAGRLHLTAAPSDRGLTLPSHMTSPRPRRCARAALGRFLGLGLVIVLGGCAAASARPTTSLTTTTADRPTTTDPVASTSTTPKLPARRATSTTTTVRAPKAKRIKAAASTTTLPPLGLPARGLVAGRVTIFGDSVTIDAAPALERDVKGAQVDAEVGEQWYQGVEEAQSLRSEGRLGSVVVVALGTNGPITSGDIGDMVHALAGVSRIVFVTDHVPTRYWQDPNNHLLEQAATRYRNVAVADWATLALHHPDWFYSDEVHMPIGGPGAAAMAALIAKKV